MVTCDGTFPPILSRPPHLRTRGWDKLNIRDTYQLRPREDRLRDQGLIPLHEIATLLAVSTSTIKDWYHAGLVGGQRYNDKGQVLYQPPGPNPPTPHHGRRLTNR